MNPKMQGHNHGGKGHLLGMLGIGALVLVVLLGAGRSFQEALPFALFLACPLMMVGMLIMMRGGHEHQHDSDTTDHRNAADAHEHDAPTEWQDTPTTNSAQCPKTTALPWPDLPGPDQLGHLFLPQPGLQQTFTRRLPRCSFAWQTVEA